MSEMIERVARAISPSAFSEGPSVTGRPSREAARAKAHAAIEAMREPTDTMERASYGWGLFHHKARYRAMIDAALGSQCDSEA